MKTKFSETNQSAFFKLRLLLGLFTVLAGVFLALAGFGAFSARGANIAQAHQKDKIVTRSTNSLVPNGFDCSRIHELGIDRQLNFWAGAIMIACGQAQGGSPSLGGTLSRFIQNLLPAPLVYGTADVDIVTGPETYPNITQSETFIATNPDNPNQIVVAYNDSRGVNANPVQIAGASVSTDGGNTFTRLTGADGQSPFNGGGLNYGDPVVVYNRPTATWHTIWLDGGCGSGSPGIGGYKSTTPWDPNSWSHYCIHNNTNDDRDSGWADNNPSSPFYGRMYVSWNDFNVNGGALFVRYSTDNGNTWTNSRQLSNTYYVNAQIAGDLATGDVYVAAMDLMGGGLGNRANLFYKSTDGGNTWTNTYTGPAFPAPGRGAEGFYATMYNNPPYWRHFGFGQPAALNGVVHYVYAARNSGNGDPSDIFYIRSTDRGQTFSAPLQLNTDTDHTKAQWAPSLSLTESGSLLAVWYDERERTTDCQPTGNPCYRMWARRSTDNGVTWSPDDAFSDIVSPLPLQADPNIVSIYVGDYDYAIASPTQHLAAWADGRVSISGPQQDVFFDRQALGLAVASTDPCVSCVVFIQPSDFVVNVSDPVDTSTVQASDFTVNGTPSNLPPTFSNGNATITFHYASTPVSNQGLQTMHIPAGAFTRVSDDSPVLEFNGTFRYDALLLQVVSTNPPVGDTFTPPGPGTYTYDVNFSEPVNPSSVQTSDLILSGVPGTVTNVNVINGNMTAEFTLNLTGIFSGTLTVNIAGGTITDQFGNPGAAFAGNYQYVAGNWCDSGIIQNGGFETGDLTGWVITGHNNDPVVTNTNPHTGTYSAAAGDFGPYPSPEPTGFSRFYQLFTVPAGQSTLSFWHWDYSTDPSSDYQFAYIVNPNGIILHVIFARSRNGQTWINEQVDMAPWAGQNVRIAFGVEQDGFGDPTGMYVDDVALYLPCATPTPTPTPTATATPTPTATATSTPAPRATPTPRQRPSPRPRLTT